MGRDDSDIAGNLRIGPTTLGMVRISVEGEGFDIPLDFDPDEACEIAEELRAAAGVARGIAAGAAGGTAGGGAARPPGAAGGRAAQGSARRPVKPAP